METAIFAGGCFWCVQAVFARVRGVASVEAGYTGGTTPNPTYEHVSSGTTGHAESVRVTFDPSQVSYRDLLTVFFGSHDPTTLNRQGADEGTQYRSAIFTTNDAQRRDAEKFIASLTADGTFSNPIVTEVVPAGEFSPADISHQEYYEKNRGNPYCTAVIDPKLAKLKEKFAKLLKL